MAAAEQDLQQLLAKAGGGDRAAFRALYETASPRLFALALRMMRNRDAAEDVLQEAFIKVWKKAALYDATVGTAFTWLFTIVRRTALDRLRLKQAESTPIEDVEAVIADERAEQAVTIEAEASNLNRCLERLDPKMSEVIVLAYRLGLSHSELAARLNRPPGTIKTWVRRGLLQLRECMAG